uniref:Saposin B-type domain-containing protein n=1 Tax=Trichobilharzia regenti TaxID=157069 RepID=A0AA85K357_TRIRE|nr:unnamed protein product [Trichobilharzia regenti]
MLVPVIIFLASLLSFAVKDAMASPVVHGLKDDDQNSTVAECDACMAGMDLVYYIITDKYWVDTYIIMGKQLCQTLPPGNFRNTCLTYVDVYFPHALKAMALAIQPHFICKMLEACDSAQSVVFKPRLLGDNIFCEECKYVYMLLQSWLSDKQQTKNAMFTIKQMCLLFAEDENKCNHVLKGYYDDFRQYFQNNRVDQTCGKLCIFAS